METLSISRSEKSNITNGIKGLNHNKRIKVRFKNAGIQGYSLYYDLWHNGTRKYEFTKLYLEGKKSTIQKDKETLKYVILQRDRKEMELLQKQMGFSLTNFKTKENFIEYFSDIAKKKDHHNWDSCLKHLRDFKGNILNFNNIDAKFCEDFKEYLLSKLHANTVHSYFAKFKACLNIAVREDIISNNPARGITIKTQEGSKVFLTDDELSVLIKTPAADREVKNAFLFSCFSGLRISDVRDLFFDDIKNGYLVFRQKKTNGLERMKMSVNALKIIKEQRELREKSELDKVFLLPLDSGTVNKVIRNWMKDAGIKKKITFHCSRHTFATRCLTHDIPIYIVSKLLGHRDIKTTEIYAKLIDKKKDEAIDKLPVIE